MRGGIGERLDVLEVAAILGPAQDARERLVGDEHPHGPGGRIRRDAAIGPARVGRSALAAAAVVAARIVSANAVVAAAVVTVAFGRDAATGGAAARAVIWSAGIGRRSVAGGRARRIA